MEYTLGDRKKIHELIRVLILVLMEYTLGEQKLQNRVYQWVAISKRLFLAKRVRKNDLFFDAVKLLPLFGLCKGVNVK